VRHEYLASIDAYRDGAGYATPDKFVGVNGGKP